MVGALVGSTQREPLVVGKPSTFMMDYLANEYTFLLSCYIFFMHDCRVFFCIQTPLCQFVYRIIFLWPCCNLIEQQVWHFKVTDMYGWGQIRH